MITAEEVLVHWLSDCVPPNSLFASHDIEGKLPEYGQLSFGVLFNSGTYSRKWRKLRANKQLNLILDIVEFSPYIGSSRRKEKAWQVKPATFVLPSVL